MAFLRRLVARKVGPLQPTSLFNGVRQGMAVILTL